MVNPSNLHATTANIKLRNRNLTGTGMLVLELFSASIGKLFLGN